MVKCEADSHVLSRTRKCKSKETMTVRKFKIGNPPKINDKGTTNYHIHGDVHMYFGTTVKTIKENSS